jgi:aldose 1-epimerase
VTYKFSNSNALQLDFVATTDKPTVINLTNHLYLNLNGNSTTSVCNEDIQVMTDQRAVQIQGKGPTGEISSVVGTPFDFTKRSLLKEHLGICQGTQFDNPATVPSMPPGMARSFNEPFVLHDGDRHVNRVAARLHDAASGRVMELRTTELTVHVFTPVTMESELVSDVDKPFTRVPSIAFETQHLPDSPNHPEFPTTVLRPGQVFHSTTIFTFTTDAKH